MPNALTLEDMSPGLVKVVERAQREPEGRFHALAHLIDVPALGRAYRRQRSDECKKFKRPLPPPASAHSVPPCSRWCTCQGVPFSRRATGSRWPALSVASRPPGGQGLPDRTGSGPLRAARGRTAANRYRSAIARRLRRHEEA